MLIGRGFSEEALLSVSGIVLAIGGIFVSVLSILQGAAAVEVTVGLAKLGDIYKALMKKVKELEEKEK